MKDIDPIIFGVATGCAIVGVFLIGGEIYERIKHHKDGGEKQWNRLTDRLLTR
jgi:phosphoribosylaminoimidazole (AIR) synthetase